MVLIHRMNTKIVVKVEDIIQRNYNVKSFRLKLPFAPEFKAGQFLAVTLNNDPQLKRYLSISNSPTENKYLEFTKKITQSDFSKALDNLKAGSELLMEYPFGNFTLGEDKKVAFLSGGIGITPIRSICRFAADEELDIDICLIYANRVARDIVFKDDFEKMQEIYPKLKVTHVLCEPEPGFKCTAGFINAAVVRKEVPDYAERKFYICGPPQMVEAMRKILSQELLLKDTRIVTENFQGY